MNIKGSKILITGSSGFIGSNLTSKLQQLEAITFTPSHSTLDLTSYPSTDHYFQNWKREIGNFDICFHLAARVGGIGANQMSPVQFFEDNMTMGMNIIKSCLNHRVGKLIFLGTTCSHAATPNTIPFIEEELFNGRPEHTNEPYGIAKRALLTLLRAYANQYGLKCAYLIPTNTYGPFDHFNTTTSHVIPALIMKFNQVRLGLADHISIWGTGTPTRDFLYVDDLVDAMILAAEKLPISYPKKEQPDPINIGSGTETSIMDIIRCLQEIFQVEVPYIFDDSKPDGQMRRVLNISKAKSVLGWSPKIELREGLERTVEWYLRR